MREAVAALGKVGPLDGVRVMLRSKLPAGVKELRRQIDEFAGLREQQIESWAPDPAPTVVDAARHIGTLAGQVAVEGRQVAGRAALEGKRAIGGWLVGLGSKLQNDHTEAAEEQESYDR